MKKEMMVLFCLLLSASGFTSTDPATCGPQTPRDISNVYGENEISFEMAPSSNKLNLCNIHFHKNAEHKGPGFSIFRGERNDGGYACNAKVDRRFKKFKNLGPGACKGVKAGDTIEVHWVHSSCDVKPGPTLGACLGEGCTNPKLRVETQVFLLVNDSEATDFNQFATLVKRDGFHQPQSLPSREGAIQFLGSATGPKFNNSCSPFQVTWSVTPKCQELDIKTLHKWCEKNQFNENDAHGVRQLVTDPKFLSPIKN